MKKILQNFRWYEGLLILTIIGVIITQVYFEMNLIDLMAEIIGKVTMSAPIKSIAQSGKKMAITSAIILACAIYGHLVSSVVAANFARRLRASIFFKVNSFSEEEINKFSTASLITRSTNDVTQVQDTMQVALRMMIFAPTMSIFAITKIVNSSFELSMSTAVAVLLLFISFVTMFILVKPAFEKMQKTTDEMTLVARENLTGIRVIRAYNNEDYQKEKFEKVNTKLTGINYYVGKVFAFMDPVMSIIMNGLSLVVYWLGAYLINTGTLQYQNLVAFTQYGFHILMSFLFLSIALIMLPRGIVSLHRINEVLRTENKIKDGAFEGKTEEVGTVEFKKVSFRYPNAEMNMLEDISFKVNKGETIAFIGSTGSCKSTLINLIPRLFDVTYGEILVDGVNVKDYKLADLHNKIGFVPQKGVLFSGTIRSNVCYGKEDASEEDISKALDIAQANFVYDLDKGLEHPIAQGGTNVSGGQRQRLCIARTVMKNTEIYVFDDSFSALDYKTDRALRDALKKEIKDATKIIVAQRVGTIMDADKIIVLDNGRVVGEGTHSELLGTCPVYKEIALSQLSAEELANG